MLVKGDIVTRAVEYELKITYEAWTDDMIVRALLDQAWNGLYLSHFNRHTHRIFIDL